MKWKSYHISTIALALCLHWTPTTAKTTPTWNDPRPSTNPNKTVRFNAFTNPPKTLDPARSYSSDELRFIGQIYEPPLQYHYLHRPYKLIPLTAAKMPTTTYLNKNMQPLPTNAPKTEIAYTRYDIYIKPNIKYQPHPAFAEPPINVNKLPARIQNLTKFPNVGTRNLTAADYVYEIKRLASPTVNSPIFGLMSKHIVGLDKLRTELIAAKEKNKHGFLNLNNFQLAGAKVISPTHYQILIYGHYPQFLYWLAMPFFGPAPWEADAFYSQPGMKDRNLSWDWFPVGTGPYQLTINNPNQKMVLTKNPNYRPDQYPSNGEEGDKEKGYLHSSGENMPFIHEVIFLLDKESIPRWNKFLQGYYDKSGISADSFDQAIQISPSGKPVLTPELKKTGLRLQVAVNPSLSYIGFNMLDPVVGGNSERARLLRQAISIAINYEEFINLFRNGRGIPAQSPVPPGIFGYVDGEHGVNPYTYVWLDGKPQRKSIEHAQELLKKAGYPKGRDPKTGQPLIIRYDTASTGSPEDKSYFAWLRKQFDQLGIDLHVQSTLYNRFRDKVRTGQAQMFSWGWLADYPDPENFLFLFYSNNAKVKHGGENATNYNNPKADALFEQIRTLENGPEREQKVKEMVKILQHDSPMIWGFHPIDYTLSHQWNAPNKVHAVAQNNLKYEKVNMNARNQAIHSWNQPITWPFIFGGIFVFLIGLPATIYYQLRQRRPSTKRYQSKEQE